MKCKPLVADGLGEDYQSWLASNPKNVDRSWGYILNRVDVGTAAILSTLFWPAFVEVDGCILLAEHYDPDNFREWWKSLNGDRERVEAMLNHSHVYDLFAQTVVRSPDSQLGLYERVACVLQNTWRAALQQAYPSKTFEFNYATEPDDYGPTITFWQTT